MSEQRRDLLELLETPDMVHVSGANALLMNRGDSSSVM